MGRLVVKAGLLFVSSLTLVLACGSKHQSTFLGGPDGGSPLGPTDSGMGSMFGVDVGIPCTGVHCSSDLHSVLDCDGKVVKACPSDMGCSAGTCVAACNSASDNKSNIGCEYYAVDPDVYQGFAGLDGIAGACYAAFVANTWGTPIELAVDYNGQALDPTGFAYIPAGTGGNITYAKLTTNQLPAGQVAILFLNRLASAPAALAPLNYDCPKGITPALTATDGAVHGTGLGAAFHIRTSAPVVAYDILPYGGGQSAATSATLLLPTSAWDTNYVAVDAYAASQAALGAAPFIEVAAAQDATTVTIKPSAPIVAGTNVAAAAKGVPTTYMLNRGQVLQFTQTEELIGSVIQSNYPIGVWGGATLLNIEVAQYAADSAHQQIPPVRALGNEYTAVRYRNRYDGTEESPPWRIVGAANGTMLTYEPAAPLNAPLTLGLGQVAEFNSNGPLVVKSQDAQHPFYMSAHMTGAAPFDPGLVDGGTESSGSPPDGRGDPEFVNIIPPAEFLSSYVFFTDPTYPETNLVVVRTKGRSGFQDVTLDCAGALTGWAPVGTSGNYEYTRIDLVRHNFAPQGNCNNGIHDIKSANPFGLTVWGWGSAESGDGVSSGFYTQYVSYAYPAGASVAPINTVVVSTAQ